IVTEQSQAGWTESFPGAPGNYAITLTSGQTDANNEIGRAPWRKRSDVKFNDLNADGIRETNEPGLSGWTILAYADTGSVAGVLDGGDSLVASTTTDGSGAYSLTLEPGSYIVTEQSQAGWTESFPGAPGNYAITLTSGQTDANNDFGNYRQAVKSGIKFNDLDGTGAGTTGPGVSGFTILAYADSGDGVLSQAEINAGAVATSVTDGSGAYTLTLKPGKYVVVEETKAGWTESFPGGPDRVTPTGT